MFSYTKILYAVGQVLDEIGAKSIAIHEQEDGLLVEGLSSDLLPIQAHYTIADLYDLICRAENQQEEYTANPNAVADLYDLVRRTDNLKEEHTATPTPSLLRRFLAKHNRELVGTSS
jgi:hypothetical protein